jgi:AcrR family transcriptional regulator
MTTMPKARRADPPPTNPPPPQPRRARGRPKLEDAAVIEDRLLSFALKEFAREGYGRAVMNNIVKDAGISKTTLYSRFPSKDDLFRAIMRREIERLGLVGTLMPEASSPKLEEGLKSYAIGALRYSLQGEWRDMNRLIYSESRRFPELGQAAAEIAQLGMNQISNFIRRCAVADGVPCRDPDTVAQMFILMLRGWYLTAMLTNSDVPRAVYEQWVERSVTALLAGRAAW